MICRIFKSILILGFATSVMSASPKLIHSSDPLNAKVYQLDNGLTVYLSKNSQAPSVYAEIAIRCGSYHDPSDATGLAHYLEHLMFKGTKKMGTTDFSKEKPLLDQITQLYEQHRKEISQKKRKTIYKNINKISQKAATFAIANDIDRIYKNIGGTNVNAHTSFEETVYKVQIPSNQLERWAMIESERFSNPIFRLFHTELETVYEEKNASIDDSSDQLFDSLQRAIYPKHPYGETILGRPEHLKNPSITQLYEHFSRYYVPNNMAIIISGDIDIASTIQLIEKHFGTFKRKPLPKQKKHELPPLKGIERVSVEFEGEEQITMAWRTVSSKHPDAPALEIMDMVLDNQVAGLINLNLQQAQKVRSAGCYPFLLNHAGSQYFYASPRQNQSLEDLEKLILNQIELVKKGEFEDWVLDAIKADIKKSSLQSAESNAERVSQMRDAFLSYQSWHQATQRHTRYSKVTKQDVMRVANTYFNGNFVVAHLVRGKSSQEHVEKPKIDPISLNSDAKSQFAKTVYAISTKPIEPSFISKEKDYQESISDAGIRHISVTNPINNLFSLTYTIPKGTAHDNTLAIALEALNLSGTSDLHVNELQKQWYKLGITVSTYTEERSTTLSIEGNQTAYKPALKLFYQWLQHADFKKQTLSKIVKDIEESRKDRARNPRSLIHAMARRSRFGQKSKYLTELTIYQLHKLTPKELKQSISSLFTIPHTIDYVGPLHPEQWKNDLLKTTSTAEVPIVERTKQTAKAPIHIDFLHRDMAQAQVWIESYAGNWNNDELMLLELFNEYFDGGMSGVVFQEMREARGLAYSTFGFSAKPRWKKDCWVNIGSIGCQADKAVEAIKHFSILFDKLQISEKRFKESKDALLTRFRSNRTGFRSVAQELIDWKINRYSWNPNAFIYKKLESVTVDDLKAFYQKRIAKKHKRISIVGDKDRINLDMLKTMGTFKELSTKHIFAK